MKYGARKKMIEKALLTAMLQEFFSDQYDKGMQRRFIEGLNSDFEEVMKDFNSFVTLKNLQLDNSVNRVNFHEATKLIMDEVCAFKTHCIKYHHKVLTESADRAKEMAMRHKEGVH